MYCLFRLRGAGVSLMYSMSALPQPDKFKKVALPCGPMDRCGCSKSNFDSANTYSLIFEHCLVERTGALCASMCDLTFDAVAECYFSHVMLLILVESCQS